MAPRKSAKAEKATTKKSKDRVLKRPERGYHTFRNGLLNVTPKSNEEMELVKANENSPLLRLPPEIRNNIWKFVLGGNVFRARRSELGFITLHPLSSSTNSHNAMAVLRTCRQIYSETALMPLQLNTFSFNNPNCIRWGLERFRPSQRKKIAVLQLDIPSYSKILPLDQWSVDPSNCSLAIYLPGLEELHIRIFSAPVLDEVAVQKIKKRVLEELEPDLQDISVNLKMEQKEYDWGFYWKV